MLAFDFYLVILALIAIISTTWTIKPRTNMLSQRSASMPSTQSSNTELLPLRQTQQISMQDGGLLLL